MPGLAYRTLAVTAVLAAAVVSAQTSIHADDACKLTPLGNGDVATVRDGRTLLLADGREVLLAGIEPTNVGHAALTRLTAGHRLRLAAPGDAADRYGRLVAYVFTGDATQPLQQMLLAEGAARVAARAGTRACAEPLLATEREARAERRGLWADPNFAPLPADNLTEIASRAGEFALVEGKVLSVNVSGGTIYLNFGGRRVTGFSVMILRRDERDFIAAGIEPKRLAGRRIRVRGFVEQRRGPVMLASAPAQIEDIGVER
jgi:endonuclease YncB( thermonuclease family)